MIVLRVIKDIRMQKQEQEHLRNTAVNKLLPKADSWKVLPIRSEDNHSFLAYSFLVPGILHTPVGGPIFILGPFYQPTVYITYSEYSVYCFAL